MNDIEILELLSRKIEEQNSIIVSCSSIVNKKAEAKERTEYIEIKRFVENLIQRNKDLEQIEQEHKEENGRLRDRIKELEIEKENEFKRGFFTKVNESHKHTIKIESQVIPTSKLFKKIEKKIKLFRKMGFNRAYSALIDLYEELLEESEK